MSRFGVLFLLLVIVVFFGALFALARGYFTNPKERARLNKEFNAEPARMVVFFIWFLSFAMFLVGAIPAFGNISFAVAGHELKIWAVGLFGSFACCAIVFAKGWLR